MGIWSWLFGWPAPEPDEDRAVSPGQRSRELLTARGAIPPAPADTLGAATLPKPVAGIPVSAVGDAPNLPEAAIELVKRWEGFRARPYLCPAGVPTIGYGATRYLDGRRVKLSDPAISEQAADTMLRLLLKTFAQEVRALTKVPLSENEFAALISFAYNVGAGALKSSTLLRLLNVGDRAGAAVQFGAWIKAGGKVLPGLVDRRAEEAALFRTP